MFMLRENYSLNWDLVCVNVLVKIFQIEKDK